MCQTGSDMGSGSATAVSTGLPKVWGCGAEPGMSGEMCDRPGIGNGVGFALGGE